MAKNEALVAANEAIEDEDIEVELYEFTYNFSVIPEAALILYGVGFGLPLGIRMLIKLYGSTEEMTPIVTSVGIYGYSFTSFLITTLLCSINVNWL